MGRLLLAALAGGGDVVSIPVPLGVRFYSIVEPGEWWVTRFVDDIQYRSVVPGGFASATITLRLPHGTPTLATPDQLGFSRLAELFNRVQVVDLRTAEVAWEGRIEDPARQVDPDTWQIGALGSMVAASDIQRPVFYVDSDAGNWVGAESYNRFGQVIENDIPIWINQQGVGNRFNSTHRADSQVDWLAGDLDLGYFYSWRWDSHGYDQPIARFTTTHDATGPSGQEANFSLVVGIAENPAIDVTGIEVSGGSTKTNKIGTDFTDVNTRYVLLGVRRDAGTGDYWIPDAETVMYTSWSNPKVVGLRRDRFGNKLTASTNYVNDIVTVPQVVEDVIGRFLVGGWYEVALNTPWPGSVRPQDVYLDTSSTTQILHLIYPDGATAADILDDLVDQVQPNAYWAIWESDWAATDPSAGGAGFRFEWATWPNNWGYLATSQDGLESQPNGDDVFNFVFYRFPSTDDNIRPHCTTGWLADDMAPELNTGGFTRAITVNKTDPVSEASSATLRDAFLDTKKKVLNAGTLTIQRPITLYDTGANSFTGASRTVDPWMIRPGKLVRITDLPPRNLERDASSGSMLPSSSIDGTLFRVVATDYSSSDNTCHLSLDQVTRWQIPTQISSAAGGSKTIRIQ
jgi:hypothetical protein